MKNNFFIIKNLLMMTFVTSFIYLCGMEDNRKTIECYRQESLAAAEYNSHNVLLSVPNEIFHFIIVHSVDTTKPLKDIVKPCLLLNTVCKRFNCADLLMAIGKRCSVYDSAKKNEIMESLLWRMNDFNYCNNRNAAFLLTYAGADNNARPDSSLLENAILKNDRSMITALFHNNVSPNQQVKDNDPDFFSIKTVEIAQMFIDQGVNLNVGAYGYPNVLWFCLTQNRSLELIEFYLNNKADPKKIYASCNECIFHLFVRRCAYDVCDIAQYTHIGELLLKVAPDIINTVSEKGETPSDILKASMNSFWRDLNHRKLCEHFIVLFEKHGGKTAQQLKQDKLL